MYTWVFLSTFDVWCDALQMKYLLFAKETNWMEDGMKMVNLKFNFLEWIRIVGVDGNCIRMPLETERGTTNDIHEW